MSVDLNNYFNLGLESTNVPVTELLLKFQKVGY